MRRGGLRRVGRSGVCRRPPTPLLGRDATAPSHATVGWPLLSATSRAAVRSRSSSFRPFAAASPTGHAVSLGATQLPSSCLHGRFSGVASPVRLFPFSSDTHAGITIPRLKHLCFIIATIAFFACRYAFSFVVNNVAHFVGCSLAAYNWVSPRLTAGQGYAVMSCIPRILITTLVIDTC